MASTPKQVALLTTTAQTPLAPAPTRAKRQPMTAARKQAFTNYLKEYPVVAWAAEAASINPSGCLKSFYDARERDPEFAAAWDEAEKIGEGRLLKLSIERGFVGIKRRIYQGGKQMFETIKDPVTGKKKRVPAEETVYSDRLAEILLKARSRIDNFNLVDKKQVDVNINEASDGRVYLTADDIRSLPPALKAGLAAALDFIDMKRAENMWRLAADDDADVIDITPDEQTPALLSEGDQS
jgi:hypothetical protein